MPNTYFQFKQFRIEQDQAGMKVTTDGCLFGALIDPDQEGPILDIGTGTGLLSLMLAQRTSASIEAIEIEEQVAKQAAENMAASPWADRLSVHHTSLQKFNIKEKYKQIVSNPPFFKHNSPSNSQKRNLAIHSDLLPMEKLLEKSLALLDQEGSLSLMYPPYEMGVFIKAAVNKGLFLQKQVLVHNLSQDAPIRSICTFSQQQSKSFIQKEISIRNENNEYTEEFRVLLKDYYLRL